MRAIEFGSQLARGNFFRGERLAHAGDRPGGGGAHRLDHLGNAEEGLLRVGRLREHGIGDVAGTQHVFAQLGMAFAGARFGAAKMTCAIGSTLETSSSFSLSM